MLNIGCTLPNLANACLYKSTDLKFYPFAEAEKDLLENFRKNVDGVFIVLTRTEVVDENFIRESTNICKSIMGIDANQIYPYSICQPMPTDLRTQSTEKYMHSSTKQDPWL